jgi:hypothetical protein
MALLALGDIHYGELNVIGGKDWDGFFIHWHNKELTVPGFKYGFKPSDLRRMFLDLQINHHLKSVIRSNEKENAQLKAELKALKEEKKLDALKIIDRLTQKVLEEYSVM